MNTVPWNLHETVCRQMQITLLLESLSSSNYKICTCFSFQTRWTKKVVSQSAQQKFFPVPFTLNHNKLPQLQEKKTVLHTKTEKGKNINMEKERAKHSFLLCPILLSCLVMNMVNQTLTLHWKLVHMNVHNVASTLPSVLCCTVNALLLEFISSHFLQHFLFYLSMLVC